MQDPAVTNYSRPGPDHSNQRPASIQIEPTKATTVTRPVSLTNDGYPSPKPKQAGTPLADTNAPTQTAARHAQPSSRSLHPKKNFASHTKSRTRQPKPLRMPNSGRGPSEPTNASIGEPCRKVTLSSSSNLRQPSHPTERKKPKPRKPLAKATTDSGMKTLHSLPRPLPTQARDLGSTPFHTHGQSDRGWPAIARATGSPSMHPLCRGECE